MSTLESPRRGENDRRSPSVGAFRTLPEGEEPQPGKILSETALLLLFASRIDEAHARIHDQIRALAEQLIPHARSEEVVAAITLTPALARECAAAHLCLSHLGYADADFDSLLARSLEAARRRERVPYRRSRLRVARRIVEDEGVRAQLDQTRR